MLISIIIPTLNEAADLPACLDSLAGQDGPCEIIVADGGSADGTPALAAERANLVSASRGRAWQMNAGARAARGEELLFLHADTRLPPGALAAVRAALADARVVGGTFTLAFDRDTRFFRALAAFTRLPFFFLHFGDQGIFVRRAAFERLGGYREIRLMEDIDLLRRLSPLGRRVILPLAVTTSTRRYARHGALRQQALNVLLVMLYLLGAPPDRLARWYRPQQETP